MKHKRVVVQRRGGPDVLQVVEEDPAVARIGEIVDSIARYGCNSVSVTVCYVDYDLPGKADSLPGPFA